MTLLNRYAVFVCCALMAALVPLQAAGQERAVKVTFNTPVEVPGTTLPPGTYLIRELPNSNGNVVQIINQDQGKFYANVLTQPDSSVKPSDKPVVVFQESPGSRVAAVKAVTLPGDSYGRAFVYPKSKATELAKRTQQPVPAMADTAAPGFSKQVSSGQELPVATIVITTILPSGEEVSRH